MSVSCEMKKSQLPVLQTLSKDLDVLVIGEVTGSTAGLSVDMKDCSSYVHCRLSEALRIRSYF